MRLIVTFALIAVSAAPPLAVAYEDSRGSCSVVSRVGKDQDGNKLKCDWDACTKLQCDSSGAELKNCRSVTSYSNPRNCKAASARLGGALIDPNLIGGVTTEPTRGPRRPPVRNRGETTGVERSPG